jgi:hypothetical protein
VRGVDWLGGVLQGSLTTTLLTCGHHCIEKARAEKQTGDRLVAEIASHYRQAGTGGRLAQTAAHIPLPVRPSSECSGRLSLSQAPRTVMRTGSAQVPADFSCLLFPNHGQAGESGLWRWPAP